MKKYRALVPIVLVILMAMSWYMLISEKQQVKQEYDTHLHAARKYAKDGITKKAIEEYLLALEIQSSPEIYKEVADYYKNQGEKANHLDWCEDFLELYPKEPYAYESLMEAYYCDGDIEACFDLYDMSLNRNVSSDYLNEIVDILKYEYYIEFDRYDQIGVYSNNFCAVMEDGRWGFVDRFGTVKVSIRYPLVGTFTQSAVAPVIDASGDAYFIDKQGDKIMVSQEKYLQFGLLVNGLVPAQRLDGMFEYLDEELKTKFGNYDYASSFNNNIAAVREGHAWYLIDEKGKQIGDEVYADIKLDAKQICFRNDRMFVAKTAGRYIMIDGSGDRVGTLEFEDAIPFMGDGYAAVCIDGKWRFINKDGNLVSDKTYDGAKSFANGLAAVCIDGKWGFVDETETEVIKAKFQDGSYFNEKGSCFVKNGEKWQLLKLYRLNRRS